MGSLTVQKMIEYFRTIYRALHELGKTQPREATPAIASLRLVMIDVFGEEVQKKLIGEWNDELNAP